MRCLWYDSDYPLKCKRQPELTCDTTIRYRTMHQQSIWTAAGHYSLAMGQEDILPPLLHTA